LPTVSDSKVCTTCQYPIDLFIGLNDEVLKDKFSRLNLYFFGLAQCVTYDFDRCKLAARLAINYANVG